MEIQFYSFWGGFHNQPDFKNVCQFFLDICKGLPYDKIEVWSVFGQTPPVHKKENVLRIQWSGESSVRDVKLYDINLIPAAPSKNVIPFSLAQFDFHASDRSLLTAPRKYKQGGRFCTFIVSNGNSPVRTNFFRELSKHVFVDSCGGFLKNWSGPPAPQFNTNEYFTFLNSWKFMICFENTKHDYYFTEKLLNAYCGGTIPIYWGCPQIKEYINEKAVLILEENTPQSVNKLIDRIIELNNNEELYIQMYNQPFFKNNEIPYIFTKEYLNQELKEKLV